MSTNFLSVISQAKARIDSLNQQKATVDQQIGQVTSDLGVANTELTGRQTELGNAETALSNFQVPEAADAPIREDFTTVGEDGSEVFDQAAFDAENAKYEASVRAHDEAVAQKQQLEADVTTKKGEVDVAQANCDGLEQTRQAKEGEQAVIIDDLNVAMEELRTAEAQQAEVEAAARAEAQAAVPDQPEEAQPEEEQHFKEVPVQNNKGWDHYAQMELEAELGRKPTPQEIRERSSEIKQRNIEAGKVNEKGSLVVGKDKTILLRDEIDETSLQTGEEAVQAYKDGQEYLAKKAAEEEAAIEAERAAYEAQVEQNKKAAEDGLRAELSNLTEAELDHIQHAADMSDDAIDDAIGEFLGDLDKAASIGDNYGQDAGKLMGRLAKKYGYQNAQKMVGRLCNTVATKAGKVVPFANAGIATYGIYKVANGDMSGLYDVADVVISYIPVVGTLYSLVGTENMVKFGEKYLQALGKCDDRLASQQIINNCDNDFIRSYATAGLWSK